METINKTEALKRLTSLENEAKKLRQIIEAPVSIIERLFTIHDACNETGTDINTIFPKDYDAVDKARKTLEIFAEALREGKPASKCFYYPYFDRSGGGFRFNDCVHGYGSTGVGARLRVDTPEKATYFGKQMLDVWKVYINGTN